MDETICAIATNQGGAIAIIRVSGENAVQIVSSIFKGKDLKMVKSHTINYGFIVDGSEIVDEVLVSVMLSPKTYTMEDIVEINTHGGFASTNKVLELLLKNGCRLAEPGEFTKRAFLNGRIDLLEAEAVSDKINAVTQKQNQLANNQLNGKVSNLINELRDDMIQIISNINVNIDYPEYDDVDVITNDILIPSINKLKSKIVNILKESKNGRIIRDGIKTAIVGSPNVGKSSLLNELLGNEKAIVTDVAGTTRDIVEGQIVINGILLNVIDTAGIRKTDDLVESIGVNKSIQLIKDADLVLFVLNNNEIITGELKDIYREIKNKNHILIINKIDLDTKIDISNLDINNSNVVKMSIKNHLGIDDLKDKIVELFNISQIESSDPTYLSNARSIGILEKCLNRINDVEVGLENNVPIDMIELDIKSIWEELGYINGSSYDDELLDEMFSRFCLGK